MPRVDYTSRPDNPPAVILGGSWNAVSVARSLGPRGVAVHALADRPDRPVRFSRHCGGFVAVPRGEDVQAGWMHWLRERGPRGAVLLPCGDDGLELVACNRSELAALGYVPIEADDEVLLAMLDKDRQYELARELGVPAPETITVRGPEDLERAATTVTFPCALKALHSHVFSRHFYGKVVVAENASELRTAFARMQALEIEVLVTEIIPGAEDRFYGYYSYLDEAGEPLFHMTKQKIRQFPPGFGVGCYHVTNWDPEVAELGLAFMQGIGMRGLGNVEFKRDARDGRLKLIELNHRFTAINELVRRAGLDLALFTYNRLIGHEGPALDSYRRGVRLWYPVEDTRAMLASIRSGQLTPLRALASVAHRQTYPIWSWDDPMPSLVSNWRLAGRVVCKRSGP